jgi:hypothetical protein
MVNWLGPKRYRLAAKSNAPIGYVKIEQLWQSRRNLHNPFLSQRHVIRREAKLRKFEDAVADGKVFIPESRQPPWRKINNPMLERDFEKVNFMGFKVRLAQPQNPTEGFPTHYQ